jgi:hypothetical protein
MGTILIYVIVDFCLKIAFQQTVKKKSLKIHNRILQTNDVGNYRILNYVYECLEERSPGVHTSLNDLALVLHFCDYIPF